MTNNHNGKLAQGANRHEGTAARGADNDYADIINLTHFHDKSRPYMSMHDRAAQFAAYKALGEEFVIDNSDESSTAENLIVSDPDGLDVIYDSD